MRTSSGTKMLRAQTSLDLVESLAVDLAGDLIIAADWLGMSNDELNTFCYCMIRKGETGSRFSLYFKEQQIKSGQGQAYLLADLIKQIMLEFGFIVGELPQ